MFLSSSIISIIDMAAEPNFFVPSSAILLMPFVAMAGLQTFQIGGQECGAPLFRLKDHCFCTRGRGGSPFVLD